MSEYAGHERRARSHEGRREYDARPMWPMYLTAALSIGAIVWGAAINVANAATTSRNSEQMQVQLNQMQSTVNQLARAVDVLNCKSGITCRVDGK